MRARLRRVGRRRISMLWVGLNVGSRGRLTAWTMDLRDCSGSREVTDGSGTPLVVETKFGRQFSSDVEPGQSTMERKSPPSSASDSVVPMAIHIAFTPVQADPITSSSRPGHMVGKGLPSAKEPRDPGHHAIWCIRPTLTSHMTWGVCSAPPLILIGTL